MPSASVIGAGLAGAEAVRLLSSLAIETTLYEMRPAVMPAAHSTGSFAELVCSNSLGADATASPAGILKQELRALGSIIMEAAEASRVPAGGALAVDRESFSARVTQLIRSDPNVKIINEEALDFPEGHVIVAAGPLMGGALAEKLERAIGRERLSFYDAAAPIVSIGSVDRERSFMAGRWGQASDYVNCPMDREEYEAFVRELVSAERALQHSADEGARWFEGCLPVEVMASRGIDTLRFGPLRPVGLTDPRTGREPYAVLQLRRDDAEGTMYDLVGCQTNLKWGEQQRVFGMIPALRGAEFVRFGVMHRNTFVCAPLSLDRYLRPRSEAGVFRDDLFLAGQITGVEGYVESAAMGLVAAANAAAQLLGLELPEWPEETAIGSLLHYLRTAEAKAFQPMNVNLGIFPKMELPRRGRKKPTKQERCEMYAARSAQALDAFLARSELFAKSRRNA